MLLRGRQPGLDARGRRRSIPSNDLAVLRVHGLKAPALSIVADAASRAPRRRSSASRATGPYDVRAGRVGADARGDHAGRLRAGAGAALDHVAARRGALRQLRRADGRHATGGWSRRSSRRPLPARAAASACPTRSCARRSERRVARRPGVSDRTLHAGSATLPPRNGEDTRHRREAVRRPGPDQGAARARSPSTRATSSPTRTSSRGRSGTSCSSPSRTSTTPSTRSGAWPICRSCPTASSSWCATSARASR